MPEIGTSGLMSGEGKRAYGRRALPRLYPFLLSAIARPECQAPLAKIQSKFPGAGARAAETHGARSPEQPVRAGLF